MIASMIVVALVFALLVLGIGLGRTRGRSRQILQNPARYLRPVDVEAFRNLIDPAEEEFLRDRLPPRDFRRIQRERLGAAVEYIAGAARNAGILLQLAEPACHSLDPAVAQSAQKLVDGAIQLRLYAYRAIPRLYLAMLFPSRFPSQVRVADGYEQMTRQVVSLDLQYPTRGVSAAL